MADELTRSPIAREHFSRGSISGFLGDNARGVEEFTRCIELDAKDGYALSLRGYLRGAMGQFDLAEEDHKAALALTGAIRNPNYEPWALQHYADYFRRRGDLARALELCDRAAQLNEYPHVFLQRAWIYLDMDRAADAKAEFRIFEQIMTRLGGYYSKYWRDERAAIERLRKLP
jgi:tetratricopeptide (TPR) repeat protein